MKKYFIPLFFVLLGCGEHSIFDLVFGESSSSVEDGESSSSGGGGSSETYLIQTKWHHQGKPFFDKTPVINGEQSTFDCSLLALGQIMKYYEHPKCILTGIIPEYNNSNGYLIPSVDLNGFAFDWQNMTNTYNESSTDAQNKAVADLYNIIGRAFKTDFKGSDEAIPSFSNVYPALIKYFGYDPSIESISRIDYNDNEWISILKQQIDQGLVVLYSGKNAAKNWTLSHVFIIDGYNNKGRFHINMGYGGRLDGFYSIDSLPQGLNYDNHAHINFKPWAYFGAFDSKDVKSGQFVDIRDGKSYKTIQISEKTWMAENLNYNAEGSKCYRDSYDNCAKYGRLYNWETAMNGVPSSKFNPSGVQGVCPIGWHLPSDKEWTMFVNSVGGSSEGAKLKSTDGWNRDGNGTNDYKFSALPGGEGKNDGTFSNAGNQVSWWSATEYDASNANRRRIGTGGIVYSGNNSKTELFSVRCVKD